MKKGNCCLCGKFSDLSFEHVPPQSAFNKKPIFIQNHDNLLNQSSPHFGKRMKSNQGFGGYTLCESCNNNTGAWYARDYAEFAKQGMDTIIALKSRQYSIQGNFDIKPLNVLKQILTMFMSADKSGHLCSQKDLVDFLLNKEETNFPSRFKVFIYWTVSLKKRFLGCSIVYDENLGIQKWAEINFQPFGYLLTEDSKPAHENMCDISDFHKFKYNEQKTLSFESVYLNVDNPIIGTYS